MKCPNCNETLLMSERMGVEVDYCPQCRGVWLDKGELDKLLNIAAEQSAPPPPSAQAYQQAPHPKEQYKGYPPQQQYYPKKKKSFLSDFLDFD
jgi:uncharacterized protein